MSGNPICVLLLCAETDLARPILAIFEGLGDRVDVRAVADMHAVRRLAHARENPPRLVVVVQTWPDEFSNGDVIELLAMHPLARLVCLEGMWCDSIGRNRQLWPLVCRSRLEAAALRLAHEFSLFDSGCDELRPAHIEPRQAGRLLPLTASRAEVFADDYTAGVSGSAPDVLLAVDSPDRPFREMLERSLRRAGFRVDGRARLETPDLLVWDTDLWSPAKALCLQAWQQQHPKLPIVACAGFLRPELTDDLTSRGVAACWFKLAPLSVLFDAITAATRPPSGCETTDRSSGRAPAG